MTGEENENFQPDATLQGDRTFCNNPKCHLRFAHSGPCDSRLYDAKKALRVMAHAASLASERAERWENLYWGLVDMAAIPELPALRAEMQRITRLNENLAKGVWERQDEVERLEHKYRPYPDSPKSNYHDGGRR